MAIGSEGRDDEAHLSRNGSSRRACRDGASLGASAEDTHQPGRSGEQIPRLGGGRARSAGGLARSAGGCSRANRAGVAAGQSGTAAGLPRIAAALSRNTSERAGLAACCFRLPADWGCAIANDREIRVAAGQDAAKACTRSASRAGRYRAPRQRPPCPADRSCGEPIEPPGTRHSLDRRRGSRRAASLAAIGLPDRGVGGFPPRAPEARHLRGCSASVTAFPLARGPCRAEPYLNRADCSPIRCRGARRW